MSDSKSSSTTGKSSGNTVRGSKKNATLSHPPASSKTDSPLRKVKKEESSSESSGSDSEDEFSVHVTRDSKNAAILKTAAEIEQKRSQGLLDDPNDISTDSDSSDVEEDDEAVLAGLVADDFMQVLSKISAKHPDIYDKEKFFFPNELEVEEKEKGQARVTVKDMQRDQILARVAKGDVSGSDSEDEDEVEDEETFKTKIGGLSYAQEQEEARKAILSAAWEDDISGSDEDDKESIVKKKVEKAKKSDEKDRKTFADEAGLVQREHSDSHKSAFENEYQAFIARQEAAEAVAAKKAAKKAEKSSTSLLQYWKQTEDPEEAFLRDFVLNKRWMGSADGEDSAKKSKKSGNADDEVDDAEDTKELEKQDDFETAYNFRFEDPNGTQLVTHARDQESVRVEKNKRAEKRARKRERQRLAKQAAEEEKIKEKKDRKAEILARVAELSAASGLTEGVKKLVKDEDEWDPDAHDEAMQSAFGDDYYAQTEADKAAAAAVGDIDDVESWLQRVKARAGTKGSGPNTEDIEKALEDYYNLDFEDDIGGDKTRFRYTKVAAQDYGISNEDLLNMSDDELDQLIPMKKLATYREDGGFIKRHKLKYKRMLMTKMKSESKRANASEAKKDGKKRQSGDNGGDSGSKEHQDKQRSDKKRKRESLDGSEVAEVIPNSKKSAANKK